MNARAVEATAVTDLMEVDTQRALDQAKREIRTEIQEGLRVEMEARMALTRTTRTTLAKTHNIEIMVVVLVGLMVVMGAAILAAKLT